MRPLIAAVLPLLSPADQRQLGAALAKIVENRTLLVQVDPDTDQTTLSAVHEDDLDNAITRLREEFMLPIAADTRLVCYRTTVAGPSEGEGRFIKQTGGRGQYGHVKVRLAPGLGGSGVIVTHTTNGGTIPSEFAPAIDAGIQHAFRNGVLDGRDIDDAWVEVYDGSYHDVDSSASAFQTAGVFAANDAIRHAKVRVLEPMMRVEVVVPRPFVLEIASDLFDRGADVSTAEEQTDRSVLRAIAPLARLIGYPAEFRARTGGAGTFTLTLDSWRPRDDNADIDDDGLGVREPAT